MKYFIMISAFLISLQAFSQVKTGTGGSLEHPDNIPLIKDDNDVVTPLNMQEGKLSVFTQQLNLQETRCRAKGQNYLSHKERDFMQAYLVLSTLKSTFVADDKCKDVSTYLSCLYTPIVKENLKDILEDKKMHQHLRKKYKINKKEAGKMLDFFQHMDKGCINDACEM